MKKILLLALLFIFSTPAFCEDENLYTNDTVNGYWWTQVNKNNPIKYGLLYGFVSMRNHIAASIDETREELVRNKQSTSALFSVRNNLDNYIPSSTYKDIVEYLDNFYSKPQNRKIPIVEAFMFYCALSKGTATQQDIDYRTAERLRTLNQTKYDPYR